MKARQSSSTLSPTRRFRYDTGRQRYLNRQVDPNNGWDPLEDGEEIWSDYDGDEIYGDFTIDGSTVTNMRSFELGIGKVDPWADADNANTRYYHADMIGTLRTRTDPGGAETGLRVLTAFGEHVSGDLDRYGYAGAWGYQTHEDFPFLHVGARYYDPSTGRFLQRDPIETAGGLNVYLYVNGSPVIFVDPDGALPVWLHRGFIWITGGRHSWLDDPEKVKRAQQGLRGVAITCASVAVGARVTGVNPWLGKIARHAPHHGRGKHIQIMIRTGRHKTAHWRIGGTGGPAG